MKAASEGNDLEGLFKKIEENSEEDLKLIIKKMTELIRHERK